MELKPIKTDQIQNGLINVVGAGVGFMLPNGIANAYAKIKDESLITQEQKKKKLMVNAACTILGVAGTLAVSGKDMTAESIRSVCTGIAGGGIKGVLSHFLTKEVAKTDAASTKGMLLRGALGCPCDSPSTTMRTTYYPSINRPVRSSLGEPGFQNMGQKLVDITTLSNLTGAISRTA